MTRHSPLDDPQTAAHAWARYRWLMKLMFGITSVSVVIAMAFLYWRNGFVSIHLYIATALGVTAAMMLMAALMGLVFLSSGTGHDEAIEDRLGDEARDAWDKLS
ncbi:hypothetical protein EKN06_07380 [Croceicoccus ponticola]|uniref:Uncharacterized protein n=1 Tax=Croceicoccus ponticola TaxID=2217664 RepID=A0A437GYJ0_9SPHN|nr:hypothetical protein [Croceicoccus ponticola]RVQ67742.1 hypothetical protein EKN06_07380 [Croceicoccus ponticola]